MLDVDFKLALQREYDDIKENQSEIEMFKRFKHSEDCRCKYCLDYDETIALLEQAIETSHKEIKLIKEGR